MIKRLLVIDDTAKPWWQIWRPEPWFRAGGHLAATLGRIDDVIDIGETFDAVVFAVSPAEVYAALETHRPAYVEVHGHGQPGRPGIGGRALDPRHRSWRHVKRVWFRSCEVAQGQRGHAFVETLAQTCDVIAHIARISGFAQSYLVGVRKGESPWWPMGLKPGSSKPSSPRTIGALNALPSWAFEEGRGI